MRQTVRAREVSQAWPLADDNVGAIRLAVGLQRVRRPLKLPPTVPSTCSGCQATLAEGGQRAIAVKWRNPEIVQCVNPPIQAMAAAYVFRLVWSDADIRGRERYACWIE